MSKLVKFTDLNGDVAYIRLDAVDATVLAEHDGEADEEGVKAVNYFVILILRNGRQLIEKFENSEEQTTRAKAITAMLERAAEED